MLWGAAATTGVCPPGYLASRTANRAGLHFPDVRIYMYSGRMCGLMDLLGRGATFDWIYGSIWIYPIGVANPVRPCLSQARNP